MCENILGANMESWAKSEGDGLGADGRGNQKPFTEMFDYCFIETSFVVHL